ncbi:MAG TPA: hypothetical protein EYQ20_15840, partial [candidate division Zixibacteria bacterium]|nr:hypothetical protein [candidate division Zixibacteria bacterium]
GVQTDSTGQYGVLYRPIHFVGLELNVSVLRAGLNGQATGCPTGFLGDIVTIAKRDLAAGEVLDGEGGYLVYGALRPAADGLKTGHLPIGLARGMRLARPVAAEHPVRWSDIMYEATDPIIKLRRCLAANLYTFPRLCLYPLKTPQRLPEGFVIGPAERGRDSGGLPAFKPIRQMLLTSSPYTHFHF